MATIPGHGNIAVLCRGYNTFTPSRPSSSQRSSEQAQWPQERVEPSQTSGQADPFEVGDGRLKEQAAVHREPVARALAILDANGGEIWAKLDAGTQAYYRQVARSAVPFQKILDNLLTVARVRPIVIQSLFMRIHDEPPTPDEQQAYCDRLRSITSGGGQIKLVQLHTVARPRPTPTSRAYFWKRWSRAPSSS